MRIDLTREEREICRQALYLQLQNLDKIPTLVEDESVRVATKNYRTKVYDVYKIFCEEEDNK